MKGSLMGAGADNGSAGSFRSLQARERNQPLQELFDLSGGACSVQYGK